MAPSYAVALQCLWQPVLTVTQNIAKQIHFCQEVLDSADPLTCQGAERSRSVSKQTSAHDSDHQRNDGQNRAHMQQFWQTLPQHSGYGSHLRVK